MSSACMATIIRETQRRQYEGHNTSLGYYTDQGPLGCGQYNGQGVYCGLSTGSEVFLMLTSLMSVPVA